MAYSENPSGIPKNPTTFQPFGDTPFNLEQKLLLDELKKILDALGGDIEDPLEVHEAESSIIGFNVDFEPAFNPSFASVANPADNDGNVTITINVAAGGSRTLVIKPGQVQNFPRIGGLVYRIESVINEGSFEVNYNAVVVK